MRERRGLEEREGWFRLLQQRGRGGGVGEPPVMKSAIRIPSSNLQPNLYISRYTLV